MHKIKLEEDEEEEFANVENIPIAAYVNHPDYNDETLDYDFALIQLQRASDLYANEVVDLFTPQDELNVGDDLVVFGFGWLSSVNQTLPNVMQEVTMDYISNEECAKIFELAFNESGLITSSMLCATRDGVDSCYVCYLSHFQF